MSVHVCKCKKEYHIRYPGMTEEAAQDIADKINAGALNSYEQSMMLCNKIELLEEDILCVHKCLDDAGVPREDKSGQQYSIWGRVLLFKEQK